MGTGRRHLFHCRLDFVVLRGDAGTALALGDVGHSRSAEGEREDAHGDVHPRDRLDLLASFLLCLCVVGLGQCRTHLCDGPHMALVAAFQLYQDIQALRGKKVFPWAETEENLEI